MDFDNGSKLTVYESQEALFYFNGECVGVLGPGIHILETEHIPFLRRILQKLTGGESIFHAQVYFVNKVVLDIKWGAGDIVYQDPAGPVFNIGCFGQMNLTASDSRRVVEKLVGTERSLKKNEVEMKFRQLLMAEVRDKLVNTMLDNGVSIIHLSAKLNSIAKLLNPAVAELFGNYGFSLENFCISGANIPEDDPEYQRLKRLRANQGMMFSELQLKQQEELMKSQIEAEKIRIQAQAQAFKRQTEGYDYATEKQFEFLNNIATNQNAGAGISSDMLQMGAGLGMIGAVGGMMQGMTAPYVSGMGAMVQGQPNPGASPAAAPAEAEDPVAVLTKLKKLLDAGLIEQAEYDAKKNEILSRM